MVGLKTLELCDLLAQSKTIFPRVWPVCMMAALASFGICYMWEPVRNGVDNGGKRSFYYWLFKDAEQLWAILTTCLTFVLGFFNSTAYSRWWKLRVLCGDVLGRSIDTSVMVCAYYGNQNEQTMAMRKKLLRYLNLAQEMVIQTTLNEFDYEKLKTEGLASKAEIDSLKAANCSKYNIVYGWFIREVYDNLDVLPASKDNIMFILQANITKIRGAAADIGMYLNCPIPAVYIHLLAVMVMTTIFVTPWALVVKLHWTAPPVVFLLTFYYYGFFVFSKDLGDPFNPNYEYEGFALAAFKKALKNTAVELRKHVPKPREI